RVVPNLIALSISGSREIPVCLEGVRCAVDLHVLGSGVFCRSAREPASPELARGRKFVGRGWRRRCDGVENRAYATARAEMKRLFAQPRDDRRPASLNYVERKWEFL